MKRFILLFFLLSALYSFADSRCIVKHVQPGFNVERSGIPHGKVESIVYSAKMTKERQPQLLCPVQTKFSF